MGNVTARAEHVGSRRVVTITARDNWTKEEYLETIAAAECGNDYLSWDYIENADGTEVWTFEYHCS